MLYTEFHEQVETMRLNVGTALEVKQAAELERPFSQVP